MRSPGAKRLVLPFHTRNRVIFSRGADSGKISSFLGVLYYPEYMALPSFQLGECEATHRMSVKAY